MQFFAKLRRESGLYRRWRGENVPRVAIKGVQFKWDRGHGTYISGTLTPEQFERLRDFGQVEIETLTNVEVQTDYPGAGAPTVPSLPPERIDAGVPTRYPPPPSLPRPRPKHTTWP